MQGSLFLLFFFTSFANIASPGLGAIMIITLALQYGWKRTFIGAVGIALGIDILFVIALSGVGVVIAKSPAIFLVLKLIGSFFLIYLGYKSWTKPVSMADEMTTEVSIGKKETSLSIFTKCIVVSLTNPQPMIFGISVIPAFISPELPFLPQTVIILVVYAALVILLMMVYAVLADKARRFMRTAKAVKLVNRVSATVFFLIAFIVLVLAVKPLLP